MDTAWLGMRLIGFFDDAPSGQEIELYPGSKAYPVLDTLEGLKDYIQANQIDMVYLTLPNAS